MGAGMDSSGHGPSVEAETGAVGERRGSEPGRCAERGSWARARERLSASRADLKRIGLERVGSRRGGGPARRSLAARVGRELGRVCLRAGLVGALGLVVLGGSWRKACAPVTVAELRRDVAALADGARVDGERLRRLRRALYGTDARARGLATILLTRLVRQGRVRACQLEEPP